MKITLTTKVIIIFLLCFALVGFIFLARVFIRDFFSEKSKIVLPQAQKDIILNQECVSNIEERIVRGDSLAGLIENGQTVRVLFGYYDCNEIKRDDIVLYSLSGRENPLIKIVKGIPGEKLSLKQVDGGAHIVINGEIVKNSKNLPYLISTQGQRMLSLYTGIIPENAYLILSNLIHGGTDSTRFGLVHKDDILGKAVPLY